MSTGGSAGEAVDAHLVYSLPYFVELKSEISNRNPKPGLLPPTSGVSPLREGSAIKGQRYLTERSRAEDDQKKRADAFVAKLKKVQQKGSNTISA